MSNVTYFETSLSHPPIQRTSPRRLKLSYYVAPKPEVHSHARSQSFNHLLAERRINEEELAYRTSLMIENFGRLVKLTNASGN